MAEFANPLTLPDEELGTPNKSIDPDSIPDIMALPFGGQGVKQLSNGAWKRVFGNPFALISE